MTHNSENPAFDAVDFSSSGDGDRVRLPASACGVVARALDEWARGTEDVQTVLASLPRFDRYGGGHAAGIYVDDKRAPWLELDGELRFSLARIYSVTPAGVRLIGQIQVTAVVGQTGEGGESPQEAPAAKVVANADVQVRIRFYLHELEAPGTRELDTKDEFKEHVEAAHEEYADFAAPSADYDPAYL